MLVRMQVMLDRKLIYDLKQLAAMKNQSFSSLVREIVKKKTKEEIKKLKAKMYTKG